MKAIIETTKGKIELELYADRVPNTVANFVALATGKVTGRPFYDGLKFHRVIKDFMIQTGCPNGIGNGDAGYKWRDEGVWLKHDKPGILSMANAGPNTNGSQFFITHVPTPWLDGKHEVFGEVTDGQDVVNSIEIGDEMKSVTIEGDDENISKIADNIAEFAKSIKR